jgi:glycyl-tRNA synthetase beta chain
MSELLLELLSEEIPARMQVRASEDLKKLVLEGLKAQGLTTGEAMCFATPRRLVLVVKGVPAKSPGISEERKGPRVGAPEQALTGFLKSAGIASINDATVVKDEKKGDYYVAKIEKAGRAATEIIADVVPEVMAKFPWPKSQRWGGGDFQWVRPLLSMICLLDGKIVPFEVAGLKSGNTTLGHRFHGNHTITVKSFEDYGTKLREAKVLLPSSERAGWIAEQARDIAKKQKLTLVEDEALLAENAGLTEWPTVMVGTFDEAFLAVPGECLTTAMKNHQKCFSLKDPKTGCLANKFLLVSNLIASDGGKEIVAGNERVIRARLSDAKFFWEQDLKKPLDEMELSLAAITFHEKLGTQKDRVERIMELAAAIAPSVDADVQDARRAAQMCKSDLVSGMVGEFPELQGLMGRYYAEAVGTKPEIARALEQHYKPRGAGDTVPLQKDGDSVAIAVALADKLDTLVGFWAINEKPTGSGDPYQLRRAALGVIRIVLENDVRMPFLKTIGQHAQLMIGLSHFIASNTALKGLADLTAHVKMKLGNVQASALAAGEAILNAPSQSFIAVNAKVTAERDHFKDFARQKEVLLIDLLAFFADRLKVYLRDKGARHDLIDAVFSLGGQDDLALIVKRVEALDAFLKTEDGATLLAGVKRAANILAIEEKKDKTTYTDAAEASLLREPQETALHKAIEKVKSDTAKAIDVENFAGAMRALAELRAPVDAFFEKVTVNAEDKALRANRLKLLSEIRAATLTVADFSRIAG